MYPRRSLRARLSLITLALATSLAGAACSSDDDTQQKPSKPDVGTVEDIMAAMPASCAFQCGGCTEPAQPYACPTLKPWDDLPHADACAPWDGKYPAPAQGKCTVTDASGDAAAKAGPLPNNAGVVLPDGHRIKPLGHEFLFGDDGLQGGFPMSILPVPGTRFALVSDGGIIDDALRVVDLDKLAQGSAPVLSMVPFARPSSLYYGLALLPSGRVLASGGGDGKVYAFDLDAPSGKLSRVEASDIDLGLSGKNPWYAGAIAATGDGKRLLVGPSQYAEEVQVISLDAADYGKKLATIPLDKSHAVFDLKLDPFDPAGKTFYLTDQSANRLVEIDGMTAQVTRTVALTKSPAQMVFLDATYMVVAEAHGDALAIVNRAKGTVETQVPVFEKDAPHGASPTTLAYDAKAKRLYATLAGVNAVEAYDVAPGTPPTITPAGRLSTGWWPTGVMVDADGSLAIISGKGHGTGPDETPFGFGEGAITDRMRGGVQYVAADLLKDLTQATKDVEAGHNLAALAGHPEVKCPAGAEYDFPIPQDNESGPSKVIKHVILIVRENKTYDAVFGDFEGGDGDPKLIMAGDPALQQKVWQNAHAFGKAFTNFDNFYTDAEQSLQGHIWTSFARTNDYVERSWLTTWGRGTRPPTEPATSDEAAPPEGTVFKWLSDNGVDYDNMGEIGGKGPNGLDTKYPGLVYAGSLPDTLKSCYISGRIRLQCDLKPFTYALQPNDHTNGGQAGSSAPEVMIAVNDEATGMLLDGLSHSPNWQDTLLIVTEDDPQDGGDHVDLHRSILLMASPWVRRGYVSHGHYDMASVYKLIAHIFGVPYNNEFVKNALLPLDAFTGTPDYTPFTYLPRTVDAPCNKSGTKEAKEAERWDFSDPDEQPGLSEQIARMMRESAKERGVHIVEPEKR
jgi:DNA-binding beta-propeller fold protein YncE